MRTSLKVLIFCWCTAIAATGVLGAQAGKKTVWDGVYTAAQSQRGEAAYKKNCASCHGADLSGKSDGGPPLRDADFFGRWSDTTLAEMVVSISELMPSDKPGSLSRPQYVDILTFLLKSNGMPAGKLELPGDAAKLQQIVLTAKRK